MSFKNANLPSLFAVRASLETEIASAREAVETQIAPKKAKLEEVNADILVMGKPLATAAYEKEGKPDGTVRFASGDKIFKSEIKKTVSYDNDKLLEIANSIPWQQAQQVFKIKLDVSETVFKKLEDAALKQRITDARTAKYSEPKITLED